eukprot:TRINITY_DN920_c0_g1_i1.p1 TRINITY_DN920_c0_g1~~TRINITY_DN920_c0_g1_i1.p1  ORF type:complete len:144 (-),score=20.17 TRINITY_DN920_c0_g1_i1:127-558(-)
MWRSCVGRSFNRGVAISPARASRHVVASPFSSSPFTTTTTFTLTSQRHYATPNTSNSTNSNTNDVSRGPAGEPSAMARPSLWKPVAAEDYILRIPATEVHGRSVACDGGGGALGHPRVFINLDKSGVHACGYCGHRFVSVGDH